MAPDHSHPVMAAVALAAIFSSMALIAGAGLALHGVGQLEALLDEGAPPEPDPQPALAEAIVLARWAGGVTQ